MAECEFTQACSIFAQFGPEGLDNFFIRAYCTTGGQKCKRKALYLEGKGPDEVPATLLPNGMQWSTPG